MLKEYVTEKQYKRTIKLLTTVRKEYNLSMYLLMKNILTVGMITEYYQNKRGVYYWISYETLLQRNEKLVRNHRNRANILNVNGMSTEHTFFGIYTNIVKTKPNVNVIEAMHNHWAEKNNEYSF